MRYRVDLDYGSVSFDAVDYAKAHELYEERGIRICRCMTINDPGVVLAGLPIVEDYTREVWNEN